MLNRTLVAIFIKITLKPQIAATVIAPLTGCNKKRGMGMGCQQMFNQSDIMPYVIAVK